MSQNLQHAAKCICFLFFFVKPSLFPCSTWTDLRSAWYFPWLPVLGYGINTTLHAHEGVIMVGSSNNTLSQLLPGPLQELSETQRQTGTQITAQEEGTPLGFLRRLPTPWAIRMRQLEQLSQTFLTLMSLLFGDVKGQCWGSVPQLHWGCGTCRCQQLGRLGSRGSYRDRLCVWGHVGGKCRK